MSDPRSAPAASDVPFVTVVMPVRNERRFIERSLTAVLEQTYPPERTQVIVADGMSTDGTREIVESLRVRHSSLSLVDNPRGIVATGLNAAIRSAKGAIIVRVDGHCEIAPDYVARCVAHLKAEDVQGVGGPVETVGETTVARAIASAMSSPFGVGNSAFRTSTNRTALVDTVPFPAYPRGVLAEVGPFDEELVRNQDDEYNYRLRARGGRLLLAADVHSRYYSRASWISLAKQYFQYGYWKVRVLQKHPRQMKSRQFVPAAFVGGLALCLGLGFFWPWAFRVGLGVAIVYALANVAASVRVSRRAGLRLLPLLPIAFAILHLSYGAGFWAGLARFGGRWFRRTEPVRPSPRPSNEAG